MRSHTREETFGAADAGNVASPSSCADLMTHTVMSVQAPGINLMMNFQQYMLFLSPGGQNLLPWFHWMFTDDHSECLFHPLALKLSIVLHQTFMFT